jgi:hypothetical protein
MYSFIDTKPPISQQKIVCRANGLDIVSYNRYVEKYGFVKIMDHLTSYIRRIHDTANYKRQIVIVAGTCECVKKIIKYLDEIFPNCEIGDFSSNVPDVRLRLRNLRDSDIVVTTDKSFTDGENSNVEVVFNLVPVAYGNKHIQMVGRLRKFKTHHIAVFVNIIDIGFMGVLKMAKESCDGFKSASKEVKKIRPEFLTDLSYHYKEDLEKHFTYN